MPPSHPTVTVLCAGTTAPYVSLHGNWMHDIQIDVDAGVITAVPRTDVRWDQAAGEFV